jgi:hypothetical protein
MRAQHHPQFIRDRTVATGRQALPSHDGCRRPAVSLFILIFSFALFVYSSLGNTCVRLSALSAMVFLSLLSVGVCCAMPFVLRNIHCNDCLKKKRVNILNAAS